MHEAGDRVRISTERHRRIDGQLGTIEHLHKVQPGAAEGVRIYKVFVPNFGMFDLITEELTSEPEDRDDD